MKSTKNIRNGEYRIYPVTGGFEVWLVSTATGAKLLKASGKNILKTEVVCMQFIDWVKEQEEKYLSKK